MPADRSLWVPLVGLAVLVALFVAGSYVYNLGVETGRAEERRSLQTYCELAALGASAGGAAAICTARVMSGE